MRALSTYNSLRASDAGSLSEMLPLSTPLSIMIDPSNVCNFKCVFCPTGDQQALDEVGRETGMMRLDLFHKIIDDLAAFPTALQVLHLYKDGEPLANRELPAMIAYAKASGRVQRVETTTNGYLLTEATATALIESGLDGIRVSIYGLTDDQYRGIVQTKVKFERIRSNLERLFVLKTAAGSKLHVHAKIIDVGLTADAKTRFVETFEAICDSLHIDSLMKWHAMPPRDVARYINSDIGMFGKPIDRQRLVCAEPFMKLAVNSNGDVSVCCVDWAHDTVVGRVPQDSLEQIWNGPRLKDFRLKHLLGQRHTLRACADCDYISVLPERANLDRAANRLREIYMCSTSERRPGR